MHILVVCLEDSVAAAAAFRDVTAAACTWPTHVSLSFVWGGGSIDAHAARAFQVGGNETIVGVASV